MPLGKTSLPILRFLGAQEKKSVPDGGAWRHRGGLCRRELDFNARSATNGQPILRRFGDAPMGSGGSTSGRACLLLAPASTRDRIECSGIPIALHARNSVAGGLFLRQTGGGGSYV